MGTGVILLILVVVVICLIVSEQSRTKQLYDDVNESVKALTNAKLKAEEERDQAIKERNKIVKIKDEELLLKDPLGYYSLSIRVGLGENIIMIFIYSSGIG